jgi:hypothetical protein
MFNGMVRTRLILGQYKYKYCLAAILYCIEFVGRMEASQCILGLGWVAVATGADILLDCLQQATCVKGMVESREVSSLKTQFL